MPEFPHTVEQTADYDPRKDPMYGCVCWLADKLTFPHQHEGLEIRRWDFGPDMPYEDAEA